MNWGIIPGGLVSWNLADMLLPRHALYYAVTGDTFDGKRAVEIGLANFAVPKAKLREETVKLAEKLMKLNPNVVRYTKEAIKAVRDMTDKQARDYLKSKQDSLVAQRQGDPRAARHEAVPGREVLSSGPRPVPARRRR